MERDSRRTPRWARLILLAFWLAETVFVSGIEPPALPSDLPIPRDTATTAPRSASWETESFGIGHLRPADRYGHQSQAWLLGLTLPLYEQPASAGQNLAPQAWLHGGWRVPTDGGSAVALTFRLLPTAYESGTLEVLEKRPDGWFLLRYAIRDEVPPAWSHVDFLALDHVQFIVEEWRDFFPTAGPLYFREPDSPHALRREPSTDSERILDIVGDHELEFLAIQGDWMQVRALQPDRFCRSRWRGTEHVGWVRWRDNEKGPWIWFMFAGC